MLFVTVGMSALKAENLGDFDDRDGSELRIICQECARTGEDLTKDLFRDVVKAHADVWERGSLKAHSKYVSAEMISSYWMLWVQGRGWGDEASITLEPWGGPRDRIVLLASETPEGLFCARVNAQLMHQFLIHDPSRSDTSIFATCSGCDCGTDFWTREDCSRGQVVIRQVKGLEAKSGGFNVAAELAGIWGTETKGATEIVVNFTGGFKGTIPALTWLCGKEESPAWMFYAHETMDRAETIKFREQSLIQAPIWVLESRSVEH